MNALGPARKRPSPVLFNPGWFPALIDFGGVYEAVQVQFSTTLRLPLNAGLRYEHYGVQHNNHPGLDSNFYFGSGTGLEAQVRSEQVEIADKSAAHGFWKSRWGTFAPHIGFAYDSFG